ncbi:MAG: M20/M25/M40 family metallo-hydrolase [Planctomycetes bacterium]|nr:M20/M25/M40 family metallo-hydrolase [Planctomycetota bacterium]
MSELAERQLLELLPIEGPPGREGKVAQRIVAFLREAGIPDTAISFDRAQDQSEYGGETGNLIVRLDGHGRGARRLFTCHMDTIPNAVGCQPRVEGRKAVNAAPGRALGGDNRCGCGIVLAAARALAERKGRHAPTTLVFLIQEEVGLVGARGLDLKKLGPALPALGFNADGGRIQELVTAVIGTQRFTVEIKGVEAHSGAHPEDGVSAAVVMARALQALADDGWHGAIAKPEGKGSANLGILNGGQGSNVVMPQLSILAEARSHDRAFRDRIVARWQDAFRAAAARTRNQAGQCAEVAFGPAPTYESFKLPEGEPAVLLALRAARELSIEMACVDNNGGMDSNWLNAHGIPTVTYGTGQRQVHTPHEWIDLDEYALACRFAAQVALSE